MEAAGGQVEVKDMADVVFTKHTGSIRLLLGLWIVKPRTVRLLSFCTLSGFI